MKIGQFEEVHQKVLQFEFKESLSNLQWELTTPFCFFLQKRPKLTYKMVKSRKLHCYKNSTKSFHILLKSSQSRPPFHPTVKTVKICKHRPKYPKWWSMVKKTKHTIYKVGLHTKIICILRPPMLQLKDETGKTNILIYFITVYIWNANKMLFFF